MSSLVRRNLATSTTNIRVQVERLPEMVQTLMSRPGAYIDENTDIRLKDNVKAGRKYE